MAVMVCEPSESVDVVICAIDAPPVGTSGAEPMEVIPSKKPTEPVGMGMLPGGAITDAENVTGKPGGAGFGELKRNTLAVKGRPLTT
jgi:hypothetical protein